MFLYISIDFYQIHLTDSEAMLVPLIDDVIKILERRKKIK